MNIDLRALIATGLRDFIPPKYHDYESVIGDALVVFIEQLSPDTRDQIAASLISLGQDPSPSAQLIVLMGQCPALHKMGQILARDNRLDESIRTQLQALESFPSTLDAETLDAILRHELGDAVETYHIVWDASEAIEASVAFAIPCTWSRPGTHGRDRAMLKILKPGLEQELREELDALADIAVVLDSRCDALELPAIQYRETFDALQSLLIQETDFAAELNNLTEVWATYRTEPDVQVPRPLEFSTKRCIAMRYMPGEKITIAAARLTARQRRALAQNTAKTLLFGALLKRTGSVIIHGDPHAGNLQYTTDGRVGILDWSLIERIEQSDREAFVMILMGAVKLNGHQIRAGLDQLGCVIRDEEGVESAIARSLASIRTGRPPGFTWFTKTFDDLLKSGIVFPSPLVMLRKSIFTLNGVLTDIDPKFSMERSFARYAAMRFAMDFPRRVTIGPRSKDYGLPLATTELMVLYTKLPRIAARFVKQTLSDVKLRSR